MIDCTPISNHERCMITEYFGNMMDDAGSAYFILRRLEEAILSPAFRFEEEQNETAAQLHAAAGMIHNLILSYVGMTRESIMGTDWFRIDLDRQADSMTAARSMSSLLGLLEAHPEKRTALSDLLPDQAIHELLKG